MNLLCRVDTHAERPGRDLVKRNLLAVFAAGGVLSMLLLPATAHAGERFKVVNFNLRLAATDVKAPDGSTLEPLAGLGVVVDYLERETAGQSALIGLQEVDEVAQRSGCLAQADTLACLLGKAWTGTFTNSYTTVGDRCWRGPNAQRGNAILSTLQVEKLQEYKYVWTQGAPLNDQGKSPRSGTAAKVVLPGGKKLWFVNTHLDGEGHGQVAMQQIFELLGKIKTFDPDFPVVLVGDLNIKPSSARSNYRVHFDRLQSLMGAALFENVFPDIGADGVRMHVYVHDPHDTLRVVSAEVLEPILHQRDGDYIVSDHDVLSVTFEIE